MAHGDEVKDDLGVRISKTMEKRSVVREYCTCAACAGSFVAGLKMGTCIIGQDILHNLGLKC
ncbi:predicted protein [Botrytis cinerea T4]|uniref:Uncharacterized protein n=1 Tax=Botryotinia fuckeliana (strain T4) TaxID=999810 RepID=G2XWY1_BOTF4|nr:predicted protein [Botrytis cinerea T4]